MPPEGSPQSRWATLRVAKELEGHLRLLGEMSPQGEQFINQKNRKPVMGLLPPLVNMFRTEIFS